MAAGEQEDDLVLGSVGVLVLVDEDVLEALLVVLQHIGTRAEQAHGDGEQVVEVHGARLLEAGLVLAVDVGDLPLEDGRRLGGVVGRQDEVVLGGADGGVHAPGRELLGVEVQVPDDVAGEPLGVGLVVDREVRRVPEAPGVAPQDAHARRVERAHPHLAGDRPHQCLDPLAHLVGGLVGERDGQDPERVDASFVDQVGDAVGEYPGLAGSGPGHDEERAVAMDDGIELIGVQAVGAGDRRHLAPILRAGCDADPGADRAEDGGQ
jgi:hypothetical protein